MLKLTDIATNIDFQLPRNTRIPFNFGSPLFEDKGSNTYSATMSARSAINRKLTANFHRPGKTSKDGTFIPVWLQLGGERKRSTLQILEADKIDIKYNLLFDEGSFIAQHGDKLLSELENLTEIGFKPFQLVPNFGLLPDWTDDIYKKKYPEIKYAYPPIYNDLFFDGTQYEDDYKTKSKSLNLPFSMQTGDFAIRPICPIPFLNTVITEVFENFGIKINENYLTKEPFNQLLMLNVSDVAKTDVDVIAGVGVVNDPGRSFYYFQDTVPNKSIRSFFKSLYGKFNTALFVDESNNTCRLLNLDEILKTPVSTDNDLTEHASPLKLYKKASYTGFHFIDNGEKTPAFADTTVDLKEIENKLILPEVSSTDILNGTFKLNAIYKVSISDDEYLGSTYRQLIVDPEDDTKTIWQSLGHSELATIYLGSEENMKKFESDFTMTLTQSVQVDVQFHSMPYYQRVGISELIEFNPDKNYGMVLAFYIPYINGVTDQPIASPSDTNDTVNYNYILANGTEKGVVNTFFKHTLEFYLNRGDIYKGILHLPAAKLLNFNWAAKYKIRQGTYLVKNIKGDFTMTGISYKSAEFIEA